MTILNAIISKLEIIIEKLKGGKNHHWVYLFIILILILFNYEILINDYLNILPVYFIYIFVLTLTILNTCLLFSLIHIFNPKNNSKIEPHLESKSSEQNESNIFIIHQNRATFLNNFETIIKTCNYNGTVSILGADLVHFMWTDGVKVGIERAISKRGLKFRILIMNTEKNIDTHKTIIREWLTYHNNLNKKLNEYCKDNGKEFSDCLEIRISEDKPVSFIMIEDDRLFLSPYIREVVGVDIPIIDLKKPEGNLLEVYQLYFQNVWVKSKSIQEFVKLWDQTS